MEDSGMLFENPVRIVSKKLKIAANSKWYVLILSLLFFFLLIGFSAQQQSAVADDGTRNQTQESLVQNQSMTPYSIENRFENIEKTLESIKSTGEKAEDRSYFNKMASTEVIKYLKIMVLLLVLIALGFPLAIWIINRSGSSGYSSKSQELAETLLTVEERQAKLANILKEIQGEIDYLHTMSAPDLKNLIQQAESYLKMNQKDIDKAGSKSDSGTK
jgi:predicted PurR-regulated permease PerM